MANFFKGRTGCCGKLIEAQVFNYRDASLDCNFENFRGNCERCPVNIALEKEPNLNRNGLQRRVEELKSEDSAS